jgi:rhodanese-related sulfurtransferase
MRNLAKWLAVATLVAGVFMFVPKQTAAQDDAGQQPGLDDPTAAVDVPPDFIKPADVKKALEDKSAKFVLVDTQPAEAFAEGHIPGAINFPWVSKITPPINLPRFKELVLYCPCNHDEDSIDMAKKLREFGYLDTKILEGGWYKWVALKYPVDGTDAADAIKSADAAAANDSSSSKAAGSTNSSAASSSAAAPSTNTSASATSTGPITSGRPVGAVTPSFRVIDVTGKYKGQDTCYVCEYGEAPTVIAFFDNPSDQAADLIVKLNEFAQKESSKNLKAFVVMVNGPDAKPWLEKLAQDKGIQIPMVYLARGPKDLGVRLYKINTEAKNTFLVNDKRQVMTNLVNVDNFQQVADASEKMLASAGTTASGSGGQ